MHAQPGRLLTGRYAVRTGNDGTVPLETPLYGLMQWAYTGGAAGGTGRDAALDDETTTPTSHRTAHRSAVPRVDLCRSDAGA